MDNHLHHNSKPTMIALILFNLFAFRAIAENDTISEMVFTNTVHASFGQTQNVPPVLLPMHDLLEDQNAYLASGVVQTTALAVGWNWFSTYLEISLDDLKAALLEALPNANSITIKRKDGKYSKWNGNLWLGQLNATQFDATQMYMISVPVACEMTLQGLPVNPAEHPITITPGINWIGFPLGESMTVTNTFAGFAINGDVIKARNGTFARKIGTGAAWTTGLQNLNPGQGYIYISNSTENRVFVFPTSANLFIFVRSHLHGM